jgi:hypothetical protein
VRIGAVLTGAILVAGVLIPSQAHADDGPATASPEPVATAVAAPAEPPAEQAGEQPTVAVEQVNAVVGVPRAAGPRGRLVVGDSLMVSVTPWMTSQGFRVHAKVGRQFSTAPGIVRSFGSGLPRNLVVELGTNGTVSLGACRSVIETAGKYRRVFLVTARVPRSWEAANIRTMRACDSAYAAQRVRIIDWYSHSAGHPQWFAGDRVHLSSAGRRAFQRMIDAAVDEHGLR